MLLGADWIHQRVHDSPVQFQQLIKCQQKPLRAEFRDFWTFLHVAWRFDEEVAQAVRSNWKPAQSEIHRAHKRRAFLPPIPRMPLKLIMHQPEELLMRPASDIIHRTDADRAQLCKWQRRHSAVCQSQGSFCLFLRMRDEKKKKWQKWNSPHDSPTQSSRLDLHFVSKNGCNISALIIHSAGLMIDQIKTRVDYRRWLARVNLVKADRGPLRIATWFNSVDPYGDLSMIIQARFLKAFLVASCFWNFLKAQQ